MSGRESSRARTSTKIKPGTNYIAKYRKQADKKGLSMFVGHMWDGNHKKGVAIWLHKPGIPRTDKDIVMSAPTLDILYGRT
jgi:hypothetical protein